MSTFGDIPLNYSPKCSLCGNHFIDRELLVIHLKWKHNEPSTKKSSLGDFLN